MFVAIVIQVRARIFQVVTTHHLKWNNSDVGRLHGMFAFPLTCGVKNYAIPMVTPSPELLIFAISIAMDATSIAKD